MIRHAPLILFLFNAACDGEICLECDIWKPGGSHSDKCWLMLHKAKGIASTTDVVLKRRSLVLLTFCLNASEDPRDVDREPCP